MQPDVKQCSRPASTGDGMAKENPRGFRFTRELLDALEAAAASQHRSVNNYVEVVLMADLRRKGFLKDHDD